MSSVYLLLTIISISIKVNCYNFCGDRKHFQEPKGKIETDLNITATPENCTWSIITPENSVVFIKLNYLQLGSFDEFFEEQDSCLNIASLDQKTKFIEICNDIIYYNTISVAANELLVSLQITSESYLSLSYTSYIVNCSYGDLKCYNSRYYTRKFQKVCTDGMLVCEGLCSYGNAACGNFCYDINKQRCDAIVDCPRAEDELGCYPVDCPNQIRCPDESKCVRSLQICDETVDCKNEFDESSCHNFFCNDGSNCNIEKTTENDSEVVDISYLIPVIFGAMTLLFVYLLCKCLSNRDNIRHMLQNPMEVPLPPFTGPGENSNATDDCPFTDSDFRPGGEIYETIISNVEKIKNRRKNKIEVDEKDITFVKPLDEKSALDKYFNGVSPVLREDMAALATLKISRDMCHGLRKTKSEERPITRLLFIDDKDDGSEDSDEAEKDKNKSSTSFKKSRFHATQSKSDTDYIRRKGVSINPI